MKITLNKMVTIIDGPKVSTIRYKEFIPKIKDVITKGCLNNPTVLIHCDYGSHKKRLQMFNDAGIQVDGDSIKIWNNEDNIVWSHDLFEFKVFV